MGCYIFSWLVNCQPTVGQNGRLECGSPGWGNPHQGIYLSSNEKAHRLSVVPKCHEAPEMAKSPRVHLPGNEGGRGVSHFYHVYEREVLSIACYICGSNNPQLKAVLRRWSAALAEECLHIRGQYCTKATIL